MRKIPLHLGVLHFIGIGGIGMSGLAEILHNMGYTVQGSDLKGNYNTKRLEDMGIKVFIGHRAENIDPSDTTAVVYSSAVPKDNPEIQIALDHHIPVIQRAEMLAELMRLKWSVSVAGTHGKTTTTSMIGHILATAGMDPTLIIGGIINSYKTNAVLGKGDWMVVETDESDGTFIKLPSTIGVVTNIDPEHLDHHGTYDNLKDAFVTFVRNLPFYGFGVLCLDHEAVQQLMTRVPGKKIITYGFNPQADVRGTILKATPDGMEFEVTIQDKARGKHPAQQHTDIMTIRMFGAHMVQNACAAIAVCHQMGLSLATIRDALRSFQGVKRRFTKTGEVNGISIYDDYAHHPVEVMSVLKAARDVCEGQIIAVFQPHRYTRLRDLMDQFCTSFNDADTVLVAPVYAASEEPIAGVSRDSFIQKLRHSGHKNVIALDGAETIAPILAGIARAGDFVIFLGAGDITQWAYALPAELEKAMPPLKVVAKNTSKA